MNLEVLECRALLSGDGEAFFLFTALFPFLGAPIGAVIATAVGCCMRPDPNQNLATTMCDTAGKGLIGGALLGGVVGLIMDIDHADLFPLRWVAGSVLLGAAGIIGQRVFR